MTLNEFHQLSEHSQIDAIADKAVFITDRVYQGYFVKLYQLDSFYIETFFSMGLNIMARVIAFDNESERLKPYLDKIPLSNLNL